MTTAVLRQRFTGQMLRIDDLEALGFPETNRVRFELLDGHLIVSPMGSWAHQVICARIAASLHNYIEWTRSAIVTSPGMVLGPSDVELQPDVLVTAGRRALTERWSAGWRHLLAVEVLSPWNESTDLQFKRGAYLELGIPEVWLVDPRGRTVRVARRKATDVVLGVPASLRWNELTIDLAALFADD